MTTLPNFPQKWSQACAALFSKTGLLLLLVFILSSLLDQVLGDLLQNELGNPAGASNLIWIYGSASFALGLVSPVVVSFLALCAWRFPGRAVGQVAHQRLGYLVREEMRIMGQSLLWGLLFLVPGLVRFFFCSFVPYVVLLDPRYSEGKVDALSASTRAVKRVWIRVLLFTLTFGVVIPLAMTSLDEWRSLIHQPLTGAALLMLELLALLVFQWLLLKSWEKSQAQHV